MPLQEQSVGLREAVGLGDQHQGPLPEILFLVVSGQPGTKVAGLPDVHQPVSVLCIFPNQEVDAYLGALLHRKEAAQQASRDLNHLDNSGGDFSNTNAVRFTAREEDLYGLGSCSHCSPPSALTSPRTSIWPVTAAEMRAERRSWSSSIRRFCSAISSSILAVLRSRKLAI